MRKIKGRKWVATAMTKSQWLNEHWAYVSQLDWTKKEIREQIARRMIAEGLYSPKTYIADAAMGAWKLYKKVGEYRHAADPLRKLGL